MGASYKITNNTTVALDVMRVYWSDVDFLNEKGGIGYRDQNVYRIGVSHSIGDSWEVRMGYSYADKFAFSDYASGLFLGPGISNESYAFGVSHRLSSDYEIQLGYERHIPQSLNGSGVSAGSRIDVDYEYYLLGVSRLF